MVTTDVVRPCQAGNATTLLNAVKAVRGRLRICTVPARMRSASHSAASGRGYPDAGLLRHGGDGLTPWNSVIGNNDNPKTRGETTVCRKLECSRCNMRNSRKELQMA